MSIYTDEHGNHHNTIDYAAYVRYMEYQHAMTDDLVRKAQENWERQVRLDGEKAPQKLWITRLARRELRELAAEKDVPLSEIVESLILRAWQESHSDDGYVGKKDGFTLMELLVVVVIIGILAAIAVPIFLNQRVAAWKASVVSDVRSTATQIELVSTSTTSTIDHTYDNTSGTLSQSEKSIGETGQNVVISSGNKLNLITYSDSSYKITGSNKNVNGWVYVYTSNNGTGEWETGTVPDGTSDGTSSDASSDTSSGTSSDDTTLKAFIVLRTNTGAYRGVVSWKTGIEKGDSWDETPQTGDTFQFYGTLDSSDGRHWIYMDESTTVTVLSGMTNMTTYGDEFSGTWSGGMIKIEIDSKYIITINPLDTTKNGMTVEEVA